jgi:transcriptional regulator with XRE-family HTH domain
MTINERIVELRHLLKLTQPVFAERICISRAYIALLELGTKPVNDRIIRLISTTFGVNELWLKTGEGEVFHSADNHKIDEIIHIFKNLNPFFQDYFLDQLVRIYDYEKKRAGETD